MLACLSAAIHASGIRGGAVRVDRATRTRGTSRSIWDLLSHTVPIDTDSSCFDLGLVVHVHEGDLSDGSRECLSYASITLQGSTLQRKPWGGLSHNQLGCADGEADEQRLPRSAHLHQSLSGTD